MMRIAIRTLVVLMAILSSLIAEEKTIQLPSVALRADMPVVGLMLEQLKAGIGISAVFQNSPADQAGLRAGDILLRVNGTDATGMDPAAVSKLMDEKKTVELEVKSRDGKIKTVRLGKIPLKQLQDGKGTIAVASSLGPLRELEPGDPVPNITAQYPDGRQITLSEWRGKIVLVLFWDSQREPCVKAVPDWVRLYERYHPLGLEILGVSLDADKVALDRFISDHKIPWPHHFDGLAARGGVVKDWGAFALPPLCVLVNKEGRLLRESVPPQILEEEIREALGLKTTR